MAKRTSLILNLNVSSTVEIPVKVQIENKENLKPPDVFHAFCRDCIRGQAQAATTDAPLAPGGLGLKCMVADCPHILRYCIGSFRINILYDKL